MSINDLTYRNQMRATSYQIPFLFCRPAKIRRVEELDPGLLGRCCGKTRNQHYYNEIYWIGKKLRGSVNKYPLEIYHGHLKKRKYHYGYKWRNDALIVWTNDPVWKWKFVKISVVSWPLQLRWINRFRELDWSTHGFSDQFKLKTNSLQTLSLFFIIVDCSWKANQVRQKKKIGKWASSS